MPAKRSVNAVSIKGGGCTVSNAPKYRRTVEYQLGSVVEGKKVFVDEVGMTAYDGKAEPQTRAAASKLTCFVSTRMIYVCTSTIRVLIDTAPRQDRKKSFKKTRRQSQARTAEGGDEESDDSLCEDQTHFYNRYVPGRPCLNVDSEFALIHRI